MSDFKFWAGFSYDRWDLQSKGLQTRRGEALFFHIRVRSRYSETGVYGSRSTYSLELSVATLPRDGKLNILRIEHNAEHVNSHGSIPVTVAKMAVPLFVVSFGLALAGLYGLLLTAH